jgi:hypothetical protein
MGGRFSHTPPQQCLCDRGMLNGEMNQYTHQLFFESVENNCSEKVVQCLSHLKINKQEYGEEFASVMYQGMTRACANGNDVILDLLFDFVNADVPDFYSVNAHHLESQHHSILETCAAHGYEECVKIILKKCPFDDIVFTRQMIGNTLLIATTLTNTLTGYGTTPLRKIQPNVVRMLLARFPISSLKRYVDRIMHGVIKHNCPKSLNMVVELCLHHKIQLDYGFYMRHCALFGSTECLQELFAKQKAKVVSWHTSNNTLALFYSVCQGHFKTALYLVETEQISIDLIQRFLLAPSLEYISMPWIQNTTLFSKRVIDDDEDGEIYMSKNNKIENDENDENNKQCEPSRKKIRFHYLNIISIDEHYQTVVCYNQGCSCHNDVFFCVHTLSFYYFHDKYPHPEVGPGFKKRLNFAVMNNRKIESASVVFRNMIVFLMNLENKHKAASGMVYNKMKPYTSYIGSFLRRHIACLICKNDERRHLKHLYKSLGQEKLESETTTLAFEMLKYELEVVQNVCAALEEHFEQRNDAENDDHAIHPDKDMSCVSALDNNAFAWVVLKHIVLRSTFLEMKQKE